VRMECQLNFINSQYITAPLTHTTTQKGYEGMIKNDIMLSDLGDKALIYKPPGFWISVNGDWERWCESEEFRDIQNSTICNVYLKANLLFIRISTVDDADELVQFLLPDIRDYNPGFQFNISDLVNFSHYQFEQFKKGNPVTPKMIWSNAFNICDGIYYENSWKLHMHTIFNTWDCDSIVLFDPRNIASLTKK